MDQPKSKKSWMVAAVALVVLAGGGWALASYLTKPAEPQVALAIPKDGTMEDRMKAMDDFRDKMRSKDLSEEDRRKLGESMRKFWESEMQTRVNEYFEADPEERERILDKHIDEMEEWRKAREAREEEERAKEDEKSEEEREKEREEWRKRMGSRSREERKADSETRNPNEMAQRMAYFSAMRKQMDKRGIQGPQFGPGGGGRGPGGGGRG